METFRSSRWNLTAADRAQDEGTRFKIEVMGKRGVEQRSDSDMTPLRVRLYAMPVYPNSMALRASLRRRDLREDLSVTRRSDSW